jgi:hypothetical protein
MGMRLFREPRGLVRLFPHLYQKGAFAVHKGAFAVPKGAFAVHKEGPDKAQGSYDLIGVHPLPLAVRGPLFFRLKLYGPSVRADKNFPVRLFT